MKTFLSRILDQPSQQPSLSFTPQIKISAKSTLHLQIQPSDPHTACNIVVNAFISKTNHIIVPIKIQWSRYKFKSDQQYTVQKIHNTSNNIYMCQPSDLGAVLQVKIKSIDPQIYGQAQASIGPIRIDSMLKRLIDGALYNESLLSQCIIVQGENNNHNHHNHHNNKVNVNFRLNKNVMQFQTMDTINQKLSMGYSFSEPKIELSPKDPCKVYLRFEQDNQNKVRTWLDKVFGVEKNSKDNLNQSSLSVKIPHSNVSAVSSKNRLFQRSHIHCPNKIQLRFLSRNSRDLFLFTLRAFICKQDMKNSFILHRVQTLQSLKTEQDFNKFLQYISLKQQIIRLAQIARQLQNDRDNKIKDINNMQQSISQMTLTYLKIIQEKSQNQHIDLEQSYSMISMKRQEILGRKNFRQLKAENEKLKVHIRDLNQQIEINRFFKKDQNNQSLMFNQTQNPFLKKNNISNIIDQNQSNNSYILTGGIQNNQKIINQHAHKNMLQISKSYLKVLEENNKLKSKSKNSSTKGKSGFNNQNGVNQSQDIQNLLESLHESQQQERKMIKMEMKINLLQRQVLQLKQANFKLNQQTKQLRQTNNSIPPYQFSQQKSFINHSSINISNTSISNSSYANINQSMTSQAELNLLQKKLIQLAGLNSKFQNQNNRLRKQRDYYRGKYEGMGKNNIKRNSQGNGNGNQYGNININKNRNMEPSRDNNNIDDSRVINNLSPVEVNNLLLRYKQDKQSLENQKKSLLKKIDSLTRQSNSILFQRKCSQLQRQNEKLINQNEKLQKTIQNMKNFHELQKKQQNNSIIVRNSSTSINSSSTNNQQILRLKKVNESLLQQIKQLRKQMQRKNDINLQNSRVIDLKNQLQYYQQQNSLMNNNMKNMGNSNIKLTNSISRQQQSYMLSQIMSIKKQNQRLKQQISSLQMKISTQTKTIQKLMSQIDELNQSNLLSEQNSFNKKYLSTPNSNNQIQNTSTQLQNYRTRIIQLQKQLVILRRNSQALNRSKDLSMSMIGYDEQRLEIYKKQNQNLILENQNLSKICSKYAKDARQANLEINKLREKIMLMNKERLGLGQE